MKLSALCLLTVALAFVPLTSAQEEPLDKSGVCPKPTIDVQDRIGLCLTQCSSDRDCDKNLKCCYNGCGYMCVKPQKAVPVSKPGSCPLSVGFGICVHGCSTDQDCEANLKCCSNGCGTVCMEPTRETKPGTCPSPIPHFAVCDDECTEDSNCEKNFKCCYSGCGYQCLRPV